MTYIQKQFSSLIRNLAHDYENEWYGTVISKLAFGTFGVLFGVFLLSVIIAAIVSLVMFSPLVFGGVILGVAVIAYAWYWILKQVRREVALGEFPKPREF